MTKSELIDELLRQTQLPHKQAEKVVNLVFDQITQALADNDRIEIRGFGSFVNRIYPGYQGRNPKTGATVEVSPKKVPFFKVGKGLKEQIALGTKAQVRGVRGVNKNETTWSEVTRPGNDKSGTF